MTTETDRHLIRRLRSAYGRSTELWSSETDREIRDDSWTTLTGRPSVDYNIALCHGDNSDDVTSVLDLVKARGAPAVIMLAGPALGHAQVLGDADWICVGQSAFMQTSVPTRADGSTRPPIQASPPINVLKRVVTEQDLELCRALAASAFHTSLDDIEIAMPADLIDPDSHQRLWAWRTLGGSLLACLCTVDVDDVSVIWSMATSPEHTRQGHGAALLEGVRNELAQAGATRHLILSSTNAGYGLYRKSYELLERWQLWSRPRWVIGAR